MTWEYRIINHDTKGRGDWLVVHEVYYDKDGQITMYSSRGSEISSDTMQGINETLIMLRAAAKKPILSEKELKKHFRKINREREKLPKFTI